MYKVYIVFWQYSVKGKFIFTKLLDFHLNYTQLWNYVVVKTYWRRLLIRARSHKKIQKQLNKVYLKRTHIYTLKITLLLKVLQGKLGRGSKVDICSALICFFYISKWLMGNLLPVRQDVFFFRKKNYFMCIGWVSWIQLYN